LPVALPTYSPDWAEAAAGEPLAEAGARWLVPLAPEGPVEAGDVLLFRWRSHVAAKHLGIATGPGRMVHAHSGAAVAEVALSRIWRRKLAFRFAFPAET
jgi:NlpC/P60 family putative phage cell wall peptidase